MTAPDTSARKRSNSATSPWRQGPHCPTKRAKASYVAYRRQQKTGKPA